MIYNCYDRVSIMIQDTMTLRDFIDNRNYIDSVKVNTFCRLMKEVSDALEREERNIVRINLNDIRINLQTGQIVLPDHLFQENLDKTMASIDTGISLMASRKSSLEHKRVAFALMVLGWYCNDDHSAVYSDIDVLDNFDSYMQKVPLWLHDYFISVFRKMDYVSFGDYYEKNFTDKIKSQIKEAFAPYNLSDENFEKIASLVAKDTKRLIKEGE